MTTKQVTTAPKGAPAAVSQNNLYISVKTFAGDTGKDIGFRIVDMYHFGTRNWLQNHHWWAMHNGHCVETNIATPVETETYLATAKAALAAKFNGSPAEEPLVDDKKAVAEPLAKAA